MKCEMDLRSREICKECRFLKPRMLQISILILTLAIFIILPALPEGYADYLHRDNAATSKAIEVMSQKNAPLEILVEETALLEREYELTRRFDKDTESIHALLSLILQQAETNHLAIKEINITEDNNLIIAASAVSIMEAARFNQVLAQYPSVISTQVTGLEFKEEKYSFVIKSALIKPPANLSVNNTTAGGLTDE